MPKKMVHDIFMQEAVRSHGGGIREFSAELANIKLLAETGQISQAMKEYSDLFPSMAQEYNCF